MNEDIPSFTDNEVRAMIYIRQVNLEREVPATISELVDETDWRSRNYTRAWKRLVPRDLVERVKDGTNTRLKLTDDGRKVADKMLEINEVLA